MDADDYWRKLKEIGWLQFVPDEERADLRKRLGADCGGKCGPLTCFALTQYSCDWEYLLDEQSYVKLINELASLLEFRHPVNVSQFTIGLRRSL